MWCAGSPHSRSSDILRNAALHRGREYVWESRAQIQSLKCEGNVIFWCCVPEWMIEVWEQTAEGERPQQKTLLSSYKISLSFPKRSPPNHWGHTGGCRKFCEGYFPDL